MALTIPAFNQDRGPRKFDTTTGSSQSLPANYCESVCTDTGSGCDESFYIVRQFDITINDNVSCVSLNQAVASVKVRMLRDNSTPAEFDTLMNYIRDQIRALPDPCA